MSKSLIQLNTTKYFNSIIIIRIQLNPDFSNLQGKRKLLRKIGSSKNRRWYRITLDLLFLIFITTKKANKNSKILYGTLV